MTLLYDPSQTHYLRSWFIYIELRIISSVQFSCSVVSNSLWPHRLQHARPPCPSPTPGACSNSCPLSQWCHPTILSSAIPFSSCLQSFPASGSFQTSQFFASGGQSIGLSASGSVLPMKDPKQSIVEKIQWNLDQEYLSTMPGCFSPFHCIGKLINLWTDRWAGFGKAVVLLVSSGFSYATAVSWWVGHWLVSLAWPSVCLNDGLTVRAGYLWSYNRRTRPRRASLGLFTQCWSQGNRNAKTWWATMCKHF